jgi:hypothetical protein
MYALEWGFDFDFDFDCGFGFDFDFDFDFGFGFDGDFGFGFGFGVCVRSGGPNIPASHGESKAARAARGTRPHGPCSRPSTRSSKSKSKSTREAHVSVGSSSVLATFTLARGRGNFVCCENPTRRETEWLR